MGKKGARLTQMTHILKQRHFIPIRELASHFDVSEMTIRRDLDHLKTRGIAENAGGTAVYHQGSFAKGNDQDYNLSEETVKQNLQKNSIGRYAASLIEQDDIIILDTGTTTEKIAPHIPDDLNVTALCYTANILTALHGNTGIHLLFAGGYYHPKTQMFESTEGIDFIRRIRAKKVFLSAAGVHKDLGVTCVNSYEVPTKHAILKSSLQKILVVDSSKFDKIRPAYFCDLNRIDTVVTDEAISQEWRALLESLGIDLHTVPFNP
ncbi:DeoR/GlpR family DNA-binding transcription regulator [Anoxynatronum buryatiense]|uniref:Transcriptional regulator, DeoR family n=1 Tax=Anoxynatronum buryatiense TaxID=489973 RepID=A0AA45WWZ4_9CLOT|nr:DeoR/GlpR family DNA-binding transcription regulator [Anoxynatronum buryatiense]SMP61368.1 transcriptional regulator, DeoR family [Anoxynatronum buryatiense]